MAIFADNDRDKIHEEIDIDDVDEVEEDEDLDRDDDQDDDEDQPSTPPAKKKDEQPDNGSQAKPEDTPDYWKKKFQESSRENQLERERREQAEKRAEELAKPKEITDDLMKQKYPDWENYDEAVKSALKGQARMEQELNTLKQSQSEYHNERKWQSQVDSFLDENSETERYDIKDREGFKKFCNKPRNKGIDLEVLANAFLYEVGSTTMPEPEKKPKKGSMLEDGSGQGATGKHSTDKKKYTAEDAKRLRENNPREYERLVRNGTINIEI